MSKRDAKSLEAAACRRGVKSEALDAEVKALKEQVEAQKKQIDEQSKQIEDQTKQLRKAGDVSKFKAQVSQLEMQLEMEKEKVEAERSRKAPICPCSKPAVLRAPPCEEPAGMAKIIKKKSMELEAHLRSGGAAVTEDFIEETLLGMEESISQFRVVAQNTARVTHMEHYALRRALKMIRQWCKAKKAQDMVVIGLLSKWEQRETSCMFAKWHDYAEACGAREREFKEYLVKK